MIGNEISRRYGKALFSITKQKGVHLQTLQDLRAVSHILKTEPVAKEYFENPLISPDQKVTVVKNAFQGRGLQEETINLLLLMATRGRLAWLQGVSEAFEDQINEDAGVTRGTVRAPRPLSDVAMRDLETRISQALKKKIVLTYREDARLLGGAIAEVGGWTFDDSIETHLRKMNEELNRSAN